MSRRLNGRSKPKVESQTTCSNAFVHRCDLNTNLLNDIATNNHVMIFMDEIHVASRHDQTKCKVFSKAKYLNKEYLLEHDFKILEFTATPDGTLYDLLKWGKHSCKGLMQYSDK